MTPELNTIINNHTMYVYSNYTVFSIHYTIYTIILHSFVNLKIFRIMFSVLNSGSLDNYFDFIFRVCYSKHWYVFFIILCWNPLYTLTPFSSDHLSCTLIAWLFCRSILIDCLFGRCALIGCGWSRDGCLLSGLVGRADWRALVLSAEGRAVGISPLAVFSFPLCYYQW